MFSLVLAMMVALLRAPSPTERLILALEPAALDSQEIAAAIDDEVAASGAVFRGKRGALRTKRLLVFTMFQETRFDRWARGDGGNSRCLLQVWGAPAETETDLRLCVRMGLAILRWSIRSCPEHPIANYAAGTKGCSLPLAQRISATRMAFANGGT